MSPYTKEALEAQAEHWKQEAERQKKARVVEGILGLVTLGLLISFTIWYTAWVQSNSDKRWCAFMAPLDQRYQQLQSPDPEAKKFAERLNDLVRGLKCGEK
jgi:hypothetical protein